MRIVPLVNSDQVAFVSDEDYDAVKGLRWYLKRSCYCHYACRSVKVNGKVKTERLHRIIAQRMLGEMALPKGVDVHHFPDENTLNCTRENLSLADHAHHGFMTRCLNAHDNTE